MTVGLILTHRQRQHGVGRGDRRGAPHPPTPQEAQTYRVTFKKHLSRLRCPVTGCLGGASIPTYPGVKFAHRHMWDTNVIMEEGNCPYPR